MPVSSEEVKKLRDKTGIGIMDAKKALEESKGDIEKAIEYLRKKGQAKAASKADRETKAGVVEGYVHMGRVGALVEVDCETDFVAKTDDFKTFVHDVAMQIAAASPQYLMPSDVPKNVIDKEKEIYSAELGKENKPPQVITKIVEGKLQKFYQETCLMKQTCIKDPDQTVEAALQALIAKLGENIVITRFTRMELGETAGE